MQHLENCPVCKNTNFKDYIACTDYTFSKKLFKISECTICNFRFTNPRPDENEIGKYYQSEDYISHSNSNKGIFNKVYRYVRNYTIGQKLKIILKHVSRGTILDIGCGTGEFLNYCNRRGWQTKGIEPGPDARRYAVEKYLLDVEDEPVIKGIEDDSYDVITLWHVLEHVHELNERVSDLKRILKENGVILIAVPNHTSEDAKRYKEFWAAYDLPRHLYHFTPDSITRLFEKHGLKKQETLPMKFDSYYVSMLSEKYRSGTINYLKAFISGWNSNRKAYSLNQDTYSSQIYIFRK